VNGVGRGAEHGQRVAAVAVAGWARAWPGARGGIAMQKALSRAGGGYFRSRVWGPNVRASGRLRARARRPTHRSMQRRASRTHELVERIAQDLGVPVGVADRATPSCVRRIERARLRQRRRRRIHARRYLRRALATGAATRAKNFSHPSSATNRAHPRRLEAGHGFRRSRDERHGVWRLRRRRRAPRRLGACLAAG